MDTDPIAFAALPPREQYLALLQRLLTAQAATDAEQDPNTKTRLELAEDVILCAMDLVWAKLTQEDKAVIRDRTPHA